MVGSLFISHTLFTEIRLKTILKVLHLSLFTSQCVLEMAACWRVQIWFRQCSICRCPIIWVNNFWRINSIHIQMNVLDWHGLFAVVHFATLNLRFHFSLISICQNLMLPSKVQLKSTLFLESWLTTKAISDCSVLPINSNISASNSCSVSCLILTTGVQAPWGQHHLTHLCVLHDSQQRAWHKAGRTNVVCGVGNVCFMGVAGWVVCPEHLTKSYLQDRRMWPLLEIGLL